MVCLRPRRAWLCPIQRHLGGADRRWSVPAGRHPSSGRYVTACPRRSVRCHSPGQRAASANLRSTGGRFTTQRRRRVSTLLREPSTPTTLDRAMRSAPTPPSRRRLRPHRRRSRPAPASAPASAPHPPCARPLSAGRSTNRPGRALTAPDPSRRRSSISAWSSAADAALPPPSACRRAIARPSARNTYRHALADRRVHVVTTGPSANGPSRPPNARSPRPSRRPASTVSPPIRPVLARRTCLPPSPSWRPITPGPSATASPLTLPCGRSRARRQRLDSEGPVTAGWT